MAHAVSESGKRAPLWWVHAAAVLAVAAWGVSFINTKVLMDYGFSPVEVYVFRSVIAYVLLLCFSYKRLRTLSWRHELLFLLCGFCGGSIYFVAENAALLYTSATNVSLITSTSPLINALLVGLLYKDERPSRGIVIGSAIAMAGVSMVILGGSTEGIGGGILGDGLSLLAAICWSIYALLLRKLQVFYSAIFVTRKTFFYGLITSLPYLMLEPSHLTIGTFTETAVWVNLLILAVVASSLSFVIWAWVISHIGAVKAGNYLYFQPIVTMIFGAIVLHETMGIIGVIGCFVTIFGVISGEKFATKRLK